VEPSDFVHILCEGETSSCCLSGSFHHSDGFLHDLPTWRPCPQGIHMYFFLTRIPEVRPPSRLEASARADISGFLLISSWWGISTYCISTVYYCTYYILSSSQKSRWMQVVPVPSSQGIQSFRTREFHHRFS
jgi:hypothetical protein